MMTISDLFWRVIGKVLAWRPVADRLIRLAQRTPYEHLGEYMDRWWLVPDERFPATGWRGWVQRRGIAVRIHHIQEADDQRHPHDHPWECRTVVLRGWYIHWGHHEMPELLLAGDTTTLGYERYHRITTVPVGGAWTLFITGPYLGTWGFLVNGRKVPHREYLSARD